MLNVVTVEVGDYLGRGREYVEKLHDMVRRNLAAGFRGRFVVLTDCLERYVGLEGVEARALPWNTPRSWWAKMELFNPALFEDGDRVLYFDLDTCITGALDPLAAYPGAFGILRDVYRPNGFQSSVMAFGARTKLVTSIWEEFHARAQHAQLQWPGGDQEFLECFWREYLPQRMAREGHAGAPWPPDLLQNCFPGQLRSYKAECCWGIPRGTSVVFFHGEPRPHDVLTGWVPEVWKVGGGTSAELVLVGTVAQEEVLRNVQVNLAGGFRQVGFIAQPHELHAVICAGGPSLEDYVLTIATLQRQGALIFTVNGVERFLRARGMQGNFHVMMDARPQMLEMHCRGGQKLYASIMNPAVTHQAASEPETRVTLWHPHTEGIEELVPKGALIGGGTTVGLRAMALAYAMGFRKITCIGFDSCYAEDRRHHAYDQALNDGERVIDCIVRGKKFRAAPWMIQQADDWRRIAVALTQQKVDLRVMGDGMIGEIARSMNEQYVEIDGTWWPSSDMETRSAMIAGLEDLERYIEMCAPERRRLVVQAGGNVGLFAKRLASSFEAVYTFEPDPENFECLKRNVGRRGPGEGHVRAHPVALGSHRGACAIEREVGNCGATRVIEVVEDPNEHSVFRIVTLDTFELAACDLLLLDVEGFELPALEGAEETILRHSPLIVVELKGHGERYGYKDQELIDWLQARGYRRQGVAHRDVIFKREIL